MSETAAWAITGVCGAVVLACIAELFSRGKSSLRRVAVVMGVTLAIDIAVAEFVHWSVMWVPLLSVHLLAARVVLMRPANRTHVVIGVLYAVLAAVDVAFAVHTQKALVWSVYMDMINVFTIAQAGALLTGVLSNGNTGNRRVSGGGRRDNLSGASDLGVSR